MAHHKGYGEKLEEAREGKAVMNKARVVNSVFEDGQVVREKLLEVRRDLGIPDEPENPPAQPTALPQGM